LAGPGCSRGPGPPAARFRRTAARASCTASSTTCRRPCSSSCHCSHSSVIGNWLFALVPGGVHPPKIVNAAVVAGLLAYVYLSLRRVYGQGRFKSFIKFGILVFAYTICLAVTMTAAALYTALTL